MEKEEQQLSRRGPTLKALFMQWSQKRLGRNLKYNILLSWVGMACRHGNYPCSLCDATVYPRYFPLPFMGNRHAHDKPQ